MKLLTRDVGFSLFALLLAIICTTVAFGYSADSSGFPRAVSILLMLLILTDLIRNLIQSPVDEVDERFNLLATEGGQWRAVLLVFASAPFYILLASLFDFEIATFVYLVTGMFTLGIGNPVLVVSVSVGILVTVKVLFFVFLDVARNATLIFGT